MNAEAVKIWLKRKKPSGATSRSLLAILVLLAGIAVLFLTFWFTNAIVWFGLRGVSVLASLTFGRQLHLAHEWRLVASVVFLGLFFVQHFRTSPWHWGDYPREDFDRAFGVNAALGALPALLSCPGTSANMIADILLSGTRLVTGAWTLVRETGRLRQLEVEGCGQLLVFLAIRPMPVPYAELREAGWEDCLRQLRSIEGIVFLEKGLNLRAELRQERLSLKLG